MMPTSSGGLEIRRFDPKDLNEDFEHDLMEIETRCFEPSIQEDWESRKDLIEHSNIILFVYDGEKIVGDAYCADEEAGDMGEPDDVDTIHLEEVFAKMKEENGIYVMSFALLPEYQGRGIAKQLVSEMVSISKREGFKVMYSHAHEGASAHLFESVGGKFVEKREDWFGTGFSYYLYRIEL
jgi:ribosomal protein S18 acetylase RimI-like enzyme